MILLHLSVALAAIQRITEETADADFNRSGKQPLFLKVWSPWCSECSAIAPIFESLSNLPRFANRIAFASFNCHDHPGYCGLRDWTFPSFRFIHRDLAGAIRYAGMDNLESLAAFLDKQLQRDLVELPPDADPSAVASDFVSAFVFSYPSGDAAIGRIAANLSAAFRIAETRFYHRPSSERSLVVFRSRSVAREFAGGWAEREIVLFVLNHCLPFLIALSPLSMRHAIRQRKFCVIIFMASAADRDQLFGWNLTDAPNVQYAYALAKPGDKVLERMGIKDPKEALFAVVNFTKQVWWISTGNFTEGELNRLVGVAVSDKRFRLAQGPGSANASAIDRLGFHLGVRTGIPPSKMMSTLVAAAFLFLIAVVVWRRLRAKMKQD
jgi:thiol-disulfide isomerase/thioredoxin